MPMRPRANRRMRRRPARRPRVRRGGASRVLRSLIPSQAIHTFKRSYYIPSYATVTTANVYGAYAFNLNDVPNASEFTALFDQYRINSVRWRLIPRGSSSEAGTNNNVGKIFTVLDMDDGVAPTSIDTLCQYPNMKTTRTTSDHTRTLRPAFASTVYNTSTLSAYGQRRGWLDCDYSQVPHYGVKWAIQGTAGAQIFDLLIDYSVSFKGIR